MRGDITKNYELIKNELLSPGIPKSITKTNALLIERWSDGWGLSWEGKTRMIKHLSTGIYLMKGPALQQVYNSYRAVTTIKLYDLD
ncbi:hypothetical protein [Niastella populi]|uniref:Uncharacterized protein n=1 Tax=Niastella populi TaxID=550983 RepID=A0A1V9F263_9BACT|nr:hypothetical protein [Niastella populi]OQP52498.1 hypothetical protein A4R26_28785 [Niastella populi]